MVLHGVRGGKYSEGPPFPVGLSMVTKLAPKSIVSMVMGAWFLATAFSNYLAALIAMFTGIEHGEETGALPPPIETVTTYANVFGPIAIAAIVSALIVFLMSPLLTRWMHEEHETAEEEGELADGNNGGTFDTDNPAEA